MNAIENIVIALDKLLDTKRKRHIMGGLLLSASALFCGLAITVITINTDEQSEKEKEENTYEEYFE